jgi:hypothetical protein
MANCPRCNGKGMVTCSRCKGEGVEIVLLVATQNCPKRHGKGEVECPLVRWHGESVETKARSRAALIDDPVRAYLPHSMSNARYINRPWRSI